MKNYIFICISAVCLYCTGCYKDKGNYDLHPINEVKLSSEGGDTIKIYQFDTLRIAAKIEQTLAGTTDNLSYKWKVFEYPGGSVVNEVLGENKDLAAAIKVNPGKYTLLYTVRDNNTGVDFFKEYYMEVNSIYNEGWIVMEDHGDLQDLSMITPSGNVLHNIYAIANNGAHLPEKSFSIKVLNTYLSDQDIYIIGKNGGVMVDYVSFKMQSNYANWFFAPPDVIKPMSVFYNKLGVAGFLVNNNELYALPFSSGGARKFGAPYKGDYVISPISFPMMNNDFAILYDTKNQRFLKHEKNKLIPLISPEGSAFDLNNINKQLVYGGVSNNDYYNCLFKDNGADKFYVYRINTSAAVIAAEKYDVDDAPGLKDAKFYASSGVYLQLYYTVNNKVYLLDIPAQKARLLYTFPESTAITAMKLKQAQSILISYPDNNKLMTIATYEHNEGKVYTFPISNTGDFVNNTYSKVYTGFKKVIDLEYKNRK